MITSSAGIWGARSQIASATTWKTKPWINSTALITGGQRRRTPQHRNSARVVSNGTASPSGNAERILCERAEETGMGLLMAGKILSKVEADSKVLTL
jgi:hypothetical protein